MAIVEKLREKFQHNLRFEVSYLLTHLPLESLTRSAKHIEPYHNCHSGDACVIIANGPSLNEVDFGRLRQFPTIGMNRINLLYDRFDFRPTYYCIEDHLVAEDNAKEISALDGSIMFIPKDLKYCIKSSNAVYVNMLRRYSNAKRQSQFSTDLSRQVYWGGTVTFYALQIAYYMGFQTVYIVGLDHSYARPNHVTGSQTYTSHGDDVNHFDPNYFGKGKRWHDPHVDRMEVSYRLANKMFVDAGRQIINATPKSKLNVFPKIDFSSVSLPSS